MMVVGDAVGAAASKESARPPAGGRGRAMAADVTALRNSIRIENGEAVTEPFDLPGPGDVPDRSAGRCRDLRLKH
jgi:hypothetical protein